MKSTFCLWSAKPRYPSDMTSSLFIDGWNPKSNSSKVFANGMCDTLMAKSFLIASFLTLSLETISLSACMQSSSPLDVFSTIQSRPFAISLSPMDSSLFFSLPFGSTWLYPSHLGKVLGCYCLDFAIA